MLVLQSQTQLLPTMGGGEQVAIKLQLRPVQMPQMCMQAAEVGAGCFQFQQARQCGRFIDGIDTSVPLFDMLLAEPDIQNGEYNIHWLEKWLAVQFG